ncbi:uncharacterized protein BP5553_04065 [Venustampulla echinocandica]|uniref:Early meiotic induction protein 1 n=1 Tax=Venustampulla echinocandica TaxID=2656787 RepID=A0A370TW22_9HELO|nr:uncharacterized protein BP5553_04065 [Venustampulla echinocandica]RDL39725.1 hypothetical protein BP5553_04065 [Venustampulla echinocandica]
MGWPWSKTASPTPSWDSPPISTQGNDNNLQPPQLPLETPAAPSQATTTAPKALSRDEVAEKELQAFLQEFNADIQPKKPKFTRISGQQQSPTSNTSPTTTADAEDKLPVSEQILPKTMSCRQAFDEAFYCNSLGGKFNDLYRYGGLKSCSENWSAFWFCMRTKNYGRELKEEAIRDHYRQRERLKYSREVEAQSSEDIWKSRDRKLEWGEAFNVPFPEFDGDDEEWNRRERERRRGRVDGSIS